MKTRLKNILDFAAKEEEYFREFYKDAAGKAESESAKKVLAELSGQENMHKERIESIDPDNVGEISEGIKEIQIADDLMLTPVDEFKELKGIIEYAIKFEREAQDMYQKLAESVSDDNARSLFLMLYGEEKKHEKILQGLLDDMGI